MAGMLQEFGDGREGSLGTLSVGSRSGIVALLAALSEGPVGCLNGI